MTTTEFKGFIRDIGTYYEHKAPVDGTTNAWYERIKKIPSEAIGWITDRIYDQSETYPRNIPNTMWALYKDWLSNNPDKAARKDFVSCPDCDGEGIMTLTKTVNGYSYRYVARCKRCGQSDLIGLPELTKGEAIAQGYTPAEQQKAAPAPVRSQEEVKAIIYRLTHKTQMNEATP